MNDLTSDAIGVAWRRLHDAKVFYGNSAALHIRFGVTVLAGRIRVGRRLVRFDVTSLPGSGP